MGKKICLTLNFLLLACEDGWSLLWYESRCFKYFGARLSWNDARVACQNEGADLVSIPDEYTNAFLMELIPEDSTETWVLIGGHKVNGSFSWVDGTPWEYERWAPGRPDNHWGNEDCLNIYAKQYNTTGLRSYWNDITCDGTHISGVRPYICSKYIGV